MATGQGVVPQPRLMREEQQEQLTRDLEIDPKKYYPPDVYREPLTKLADPQEVDLLEMAKVMGFDLSKLIKLDGHRRTEVAAQALYPATDTILTGFLGAGKTTLLNRILTGNHGLRVGVLVNDFGAVNIDAELVVGVDGNMISLANGCVCCQIRDDLIESVTALLARPRGRRVHPARSQRRRRSRAGSS